MKSIAVVVLTAENTVTSFPTAPPLLLFRGWFGGPPFPFLVSLRPFVNRTWKKKTVPFFFPWREWEKKGRESERRPFFLTLS